jgi:hypothetical protein
MLQVSQANNKLVCIIATGLAALNVYRLELMMTIPVALWLFYSQAFFTANLSFSPLPHFHLSASLTPSFVSFYFDHHPMILT